jgi:hypothetical protein
MISDDGEDTGGKDVVAGRAECEWGRKDGEVSAQAWRWRHRE